MHPMIATGVRVLRIALWAAVIAAPASVYAQTAKPAAPSATMPSGTMQRGAMGSADMKKSMMAGMDSMDKMRLTGNIDKDFALMMKVHHQQALDMAEMELAHGNSPAMQGMAKQIIAAQKKEIAQFDKWLAKQK